MLLALTAAARTARPQKPTRMVVAKLEGNAARGKLHQAVVKKVGVKPLDDSPRTSAQALDGVVGKRI
jgi:hypothetical protein